MSRALSSTFVEAVNAADTDEAFLILVTIDHADMPAPIKVTSDAVTTFRDGQDNTIAKDSTSNGNDGTLVNGPTWTSDGPNENIRGALSFDGAGDYVALSRFYNAAFSVITLEVWFRATVDGILWSYDRTEYWRLEIGGDSSANRVGLSFFTDAGQEDDFSSTTVVTDAQWHHVAFVYDNGDASLYLDGVLEATRSSGSQIGTGTPRYGFWGVGSEAASEDGDKTPLNYFAGDLSDAREWTTARTQQQIQNNMNVRLNGDEAGLVGYWQLDYATSKYLPFPFKVSLPDDSDEASGVLSKLTIDAVDRRVVEAARSITGVPSVDLEVVLASDPNATEVAWPTFKMANVRYDKMTIEGDLVLELLDQEPLPSAKFDPARFPGIF